MRNMGYMGGGDGKPNFGDLDDIADDAEGADSDDDEIPDLE